MPKVKRGAPDAILIEKAIDRGAIELKTVKDKKFLQTLLKILGLHEADAEVLALTKELKATAIIDEEKARTIADVNGIPNRGTIPLA